MYIGRFAPTPSGPLHQGSLIAALASYCEAKSQQGQWLLRIEDLDTPRVVKGAADNILQTMEAFGFEWDGAVLYQSQRFPAYEDCIQHLLDRKMIYACTCSRKSLTEQKVNYGPLGMIYPGNCRNKLNNQDNSSLRLNLQQADDLQFEDEHYGTVKLNLKQQVGDVVIKRNDGIYAYHLAVVLDDALQKVNHIVRGSDLLQVTPVHLYLNRLLELDNPRYLHLPLLKTSEGEKLSKQTGAKGLDVTKASHQLYTAALFLGQHIPQELTTASPSEMLSYIVSEWDRQLIPSHSTDK